MSKSVQVLADWLPGSMLAGQLIASATIFAVVARLAGRSIHSIEKGPTRTDSHRFASVTLALSSRLSGRSAVRAGAAGAAAAMAVSFGFGASRSAAAQSGTPPYTVARKYVLTSSTDAAVQALNTG